ncbi:hypothetical protein OWV82_024822 [Melia azedarach]|uniref:Uncharacterized protein n=1 Tax=Melia azedarach TaxID=155640 RepID=A0ACC1WRJ7_MELAZ|nr:hypothetical protein OWV82_024822 [Melia azedarach]
MEENNRKLPSLPSNYVTLVQLKERWIKEQQRKQKGKEVQVSEKSEVAVCVVGCENTEKNVETEGLKKNVKKRRKGKKLRPEKGEARARAEYGVAESENHAPQTSVGKEDSVKSVNVVVDNRSVEIEGKFRDMSIHCRRERGNDRFVRPHKNGGNWEHGRADRRFGNGGRVEWKTRNAGMVWVKKGEVSGINVDAVQNSSCSLMESEQCSYGGKEGAEEESTQPMRYNGGNTCI